MSTEAPQVDWKLDAAARVRIDSELARIEAFHEGKPRCVVCGQRCNRLDRYGCCSKLSEKSEPHRMHRAEARAGVRS